MRKWRGGCRQDGRGCREPLSRRASSGDGKTEREDGTIKTKKKDLKKTTRHRWVWLERKNKIKTHANPAAVDPAEDGKRCRSSVGSAGLPGAIQLI